MKVIEIQTVCVKELPNVLWVQVHTDEGLIGLGETFFGAAAVDAHIHEFIAPYLIGKNPLEIEDVYNSMEIPFVLDRRIESSVIINMNEILITNPFFGRGYGSLQNSDFSLYEVLFIGGLVGLSAYVLLFLMFIRLSFFFNNNLAFVIASVAPTMHMTR